MLNKEKFDLIAKYNAIFALREYKNPEAAAVLMDGFDCLDNSELLKHEVTYALG